MSTLGPKRVLIDTDPGVDDALALLLALASPELTIEAVTVVAGNAPIEATTRNALRVIAVAEAPDPPRVAVGCERPLRRDLLTATHVHGADGLGDLDGEFEAGEPLETHAVDAIIETVSANPGAVTIVTLGPLTNVASAILRDPATMALTREIICMGGAVAAPGNVTPVAEYNFYVDPEAAQIVLQSGIQVILTPLDATMQVRLRRDEAERRIAASKRPAAPFMGAILGKYLEFKETRDAEPVCVLHDPLAVGLALDPTLAKLESLAADVETEGSLTTGMLVADRRAFASGSRAQGRIRAPVEIDARRFLDLFLDRVLGPA